MKLNVGDVVICVNIISAGYYDEERLIEGESYTITDIDFRFPGKISVKLKGPYYFHHEFVPVDCFSTVALIRENKLKELGI